MKSMKKVFYILGLAVFALALNGCKTNSMTHCPDLASAKKAHPSIFAFNHVAKHTADAPKPAGQTAQAAIVDTAAITMPKTGIIAATDQQMHFKMRMPAALDKQMQDDQDLNDMNKLLANYSDNKVSLQRNDNGKLYLKAHSLKDILTMAKNTSHPRGYYERRYGNGSDPAGAAVAAGVLGPISFVFAFIPFLSFVAFPISIAAIITGAIGLKSSRRRLASTGLTFGILGLIFSILFSFLYLHIFFAFWL
jgi:hypothetical protein